MRYFLGVLFLRKREFIGNFEKIFDNFENIS